MRIKYITMFSVCLCLMAGCSQPTPSKDDMQNKEMATSFSFQDTNGESHQLSDYKGKKLYIKVWASWCPICLSGLDELNTLKDEQTEYEVISIVAPSYQSEMKEEDFTSWFNSLEYKNITVLFDQNGEYIRNIGVRGYPTSVFIDETGNLIKVQPGHLNKNQIDETMAKL